MKVVDMVPGQRYRVRFRDCCVEGSVDDTLRVVRLDEDGTVEQVEFEHTTIRPLYEEILSIEVRDVTGL